MNFYYLVDKEKIHFHLEGELISGKDEIMLSQDENLIESTEWSQRGYTVENFLSRLDMQTVINGVTELVRKQLIELDIETDNFTLEKYHCFVNDNQHLQLTKKIQQGWHVKHFPIHFDLVNNKISEIVRTSVSSKAAHVEMNNFFVRIVRPNKISDNNPPHRDVWLDRLRDAVNIYVPLCGSNHKSSLPVIPGSHLYSESSIQRTSSGALYNRVNYNVPCVVSVQGSPPELIRPNPGYNEVLVFSPYLIHGGGINLNNDTTRVSLEVRFWKSTE